MRRRNSSLFSIISPNHTIGTCKLVSERLSYVMCLLHMTKEQHTKRFPFFFRGLLRDVVFFELLLSSISRPSLFHAEFSVYYFSEGWFSVRRFGQRNLDTVAGGIFDIILHV